MNDKSILAGRLDFLSTGDLFQLLGSNNATGVLHLRNKYSPDPGTVYFIDGSIVNASSGILNGLDAVYSFFGWTSGDFEFSRQNVDVKRVVNRSLMEIVMDGLRMLDEGEIKEMGPAVSCEKDRVCLEEPFTPPVIKGPLVDFEYVVDLEDFFEGQEIVHQDRYGSWIWVVLKGNAGIIRETPLGPLTILRLGDGSFIGSMASFLFQDNIRSATVRAETDVQLGVLDQQRLSQKFLTMSHELRQLLTGLDKRMKQITDRAVEIYCKKDRFQEFISDKEIAIKQGEGKDSIFLITQGKASIVQETDEGHIPLVYLDEGDFVGGFPFLDIGHEPRSASVWITQDFKAKPLDLDMLWKEYNQIPALFRNMIEHVAVSVSVTTRLTRDFYRRDISGQLNP